MTPPAGALAPGARVELVIERLVAGGDGLARADGRVVFVPFSAPGDRALCEVVQVKARFARAEIVELYEPGPGRQEPACPYYGRCGGCNWMHLDDETQSHARVEVIRDALLRIGHLSDLPDVERLRTPKSLGYRARARLAYRAGSLGFRAARSHDVVDVERCVVLDAATQSELEALRRTPHKLRGAGELEIRGFGGDAAGLRVGPGAFVQANAALWSAWRELVADACGRGRVLVELYAGIGFYTTLLEERFDAVVAVERGRAVRDLRHNTRALVVHGSAETFAQKELDTLAPDAVLVNPPRSGCDKTVVEAILRVRPNRIVYVSCDAATLARDVARLADTYEVVRIVSIDALPQTSHVEALLVLTEKGAPT